MKNMKNMKTLYLLPMLLGALALAQDCPSDCDKPCCEAQDCCESLAVARQEIANAKSETKKLGKDERAALADAEKIALANTASGKALAPTFGAAADLLHVAGTLRAENEKECALLKELEATYRAVARELAGKESYPAPAEGDGEALAKAVAAHAKAKELWAAARSEKEKGTPEDAKAWRLVKNGSPLYRALAVNLLAANDAMKALDCSDAEAACSKAIAAVGELNTLLAPAFDGVKTEKPAAPAPAPT